METVNRKADEIRESLYQRSQDKEGRKMQIEGYSEMTKYKKALEQLGGGGSKTVGADGSSQPQQ